MEIKIKLIGNGTAPAYAHDADACLDCYARKDYKIRPGERACVALGFALELPPGYEAIIRPRSGLSKKGIDVSIGTVDSGYSGEVMANVCNNQRRKTFRINAGDRVCQLSVKEILKIEWLKVENLADSERGSNGFGSTGI